MYELKFEFNLHAYYTGESAEKVKSCFHLFDIFYEWEFCIAENFTFLYGSLLFSMTQLDCDIIYLCVKPHNSQNSAGHSLSSS